MTSRIDHACDYCDTEFSIEFDNEDSELLFCPSCGEELPQFEQDQLDMFGDDYD